MASVKVPLPTDVHVGARVRMRRLMLKLSQTDLAEQLGLTFQQVQKYEKGANRIGASRLQQISSILQVPVSFFFEDQPGVKRTDGRPTLPPFADTFLASNEGIALMRAYMKIKSSRVRRAVVHLVEGIVDP